MPVIDESIFYQGEEILKKPFQTRRLVVSLFLRGLFIFAFLLCFYFPARASSSGDEILRKSDALYPEQARFVMSIDDYEDGERKRSYLFDCYVKGDDRYLIIAVEPAVMRGMVQLRRGEIIYNYLKKIDRMTQVSAQMAFEHSVLSQEDVMNKKLNNFYQLEGCEEIKEGDKRVNVLSLKAKSLKMAYYQIRTYIEDETFYTVKTEYYSFAGEKVKELKTDEIKEDNGRLTFYKFTIMDVFIPGRYTQVTMDNFVHNVEIPDTYFTRSYMRALAQ
ncbi:MAG TPA: outer membrane lipoprotein-sorting protein [Firmicutes bacterium]|nr:outer membrane lipoprotein-sorting protein [Bacillota bacterium]